MDTKAIIADLRVQRDRIDTAIVALEALNGAASATTPIAVKRANTAPVTSPATSKRVVSAEARQRMAAAQQKRWAK